MDALTRIITGEDETPDRSPWLHNALSLLAVWVVGSAGWFVSYRMGAWNSAAPVDDEPEAQEVGTIVGLALGYLSALCYLCARLPQIYKNWKNQSCEGELLLTSCSGSHADMFRAGSAVFPPVADRQLHVRSEPFRVLPGWLLPAQGAALAPWVTGNDGGGFHHLCAVQALRSEAP
jgi:solute carrier family 66 (lysosomal lysine-arginine transporter), member 1